MKKLKKYTALLLLLSILFTSMSCEKDDQGQRITYYKNKTGEGYVFYKYYSAGIDSPIDSIKPAANVKIEIECYTQGFMDAGILSHSDYVYTDNNGKYSFKLLKSINGKSIAHRYITVLTRNGPGPISFYYATYSKKGYLIDTLFISHSNLYDW